MAKSSASTVRSELSAPHPRYVVAVLMISSIVVLLTLVQKLGTSESPMKFAFGAIVHAFVVFFGLVWTHLHSVSFSKTCRIWFDERNLLENYQTRARSLGHLFQPDPPTPSPLTALVSPPVSSDEDPPANPKTDFAKMREKFYRRESEEIARDRKLATMNDENPPSAEDQAKEETKPEEGAEGPLYENLNNGPAENLPDPTKSTSKPDK
ncbi:hypothetical protein L596_014353 [Steinernema carpocapsae]|uniref:Uncharacterized protein n=1 Tax=Steinernema carpocapsae TaxID=34508 RepID=A0A4U5NCS3_STECR|nr:hypothetical protein L596_014353 [Steinernema carpocapsae]